ncbi:MAG: bifunctional nuclease domain-containing protein [Chloroflexota bacterium]
MKQYTDAALVNLCLSGERQAFSLLIFRHEFRIRNTVLAVYPKLSDIDDLLQETYLQAFLNLSTLRDPAQFRSWVCGIGLNLAKMKFRRFAQVSFEQFGLTVIETQEPASFRGVEAYVEDQQRFDLLANAVLDLPQSERDAILMIYRDGFTHRETAVKLNVTQSAIKVRAHRGRNRLKKMLQTYDEFASSKESAMIPVSIYDLTEHMKAPAETFDKETLLAPLLKEVPQALRTMIIEQSTINWSLPADKLLSQADQLSDEQMAAIHQAVHLLAPHRVVLLKEEAGERILPIWIGPFEAEMIRLQLKKVAFKRPLSHDMIKSLLDASGTAVQSALVSKLHEGVYFGELKISGDSGDKIVDCRPSDALTLAARVNCPIFVAPDVMKEEATTLSQIQGVENGQYQWEREGKINQMKSIL